MDPNKVAWWWLESQAYHCKYSSSWETTYKEQEAARQSVAELPAQLLHSAGSQAKSTGKKISKEELINISAKNNNLKIP